MGVSPVDGGTEKTGEIDAFVPIVSWLVVLTLWKPGKMPETTSLSNERRVERAY
jgi:hypothetical protein